MSNSKISLTCAGLSVGTTNTTFVVSRLDLYDADEVEGGEHHRLQRQELLYRSAVHTTPYRTDGTVDGIALARSIESELDRARLPTGQPDRAIAAITTGGLPAAACCELQRELSGWCAVFALGEGTGRERLLSAIPAHGSGALATSSEPGRTICNIDIGGGTTRIAVASAGEIIDSTCLDIGASCICLNQDGQIEKLTDSGATFLDAVAKLDDMRPGSRPPDGLLELIGGLLAEVILQSFLTSSPPQVVQRLLLAEPLRHDYQIDEYWITGGVARLMLDQANTLAPGELSTHSRINDTGDLLARKLRQGLSERARSYQIPPDPVHATASGAVLAYLAVRPSAVPGQIGQRQPR